MNVNDMVCMWFETSARTAEDMAAKAARAYNGLIHRDTTYARGISAIADAHHAAAKVYREHLEHWKTRVL